MEKKINEEKGMVNHLMTQQASVMISCYLFQEKRNGKKNK